MIDGRYYTVSQFNMILFLLCFMILLLIMTTHIILRLRNIENSKGTIYILVSGCSAIFVRYIEVVVPSEEAGYMLRLFSIICLLMIINGTLYCTTKNSQWVKWFRWVYVIVPFIIIFIKPQWMVVEYDFFHIEYSNYYMIYIVIGIIMLISRNVKNKMINKGTFYITNIVIVSLIFYIIHINWIATMHLPYFVGVLSAICVYYVLLHYMTTQIVSAVFSQIETHIDEVIIMTDNQGYRLHSNLEHHFLKRLFNDEIINLDTPYNVLNHLIINVEKIRNRYYIELKELNQLKYISIAVYNIDKKDKHLGYVFVFKEVTETTQMLIELEQVNEELYAVNRELEDYSQVAYQYKTEQSVQRLINEINDQLGHQMIELNMLTEKARQSYDQKEQLKTSITEIKETSKRNLEAVRSAVTKYRNMYEED